MSLVSTWGVFRDIVTFTFLIALLIIYTHAG